MAGYKNNSSSNAHSLQHRVAQIYLCGEVQSHTTLALAAAKGSTPEFMRISRFPFPKENAMERGHPCDYMQEAKYLLSKVQQLRKVPNK
jgi:hypothetical protein